MLYRAHPSYQTQVKRSETAALHTARSVSDHRRGRGVQAGGVRGCSNRCVWQVDSIVIAKVDATANDPPAHVVVDSFPTILLWKAGAGPSQTPVKFDGCDRLHVVTKVSLGRAPRRRPSDATGST